MMLKHRDGLSFLNFADILLVQREDRASVIYTSGGGRFVTGDALSEIEDAPAGGNVFPHPQRGL